MRQASEPCDSQESKPKLVTAAHVTPVAGTLPLGGTKKSDPVGYERSMESLLEELNRPQARNEVIKSLMKVTFEERREKINGSTSHTTTLLDDFPFFKKKKWVSLTL